MPHEAVFNISRGKATVFKPQITTAIALAPEIPHAKIPMGPPTTTRNQPVIFSFAVFISFTDSSARVVGRFAHKCSLMDSFASAHVGGLPRAALPRDPNNSLEL